MYHRSVGIVYKICNKSPKNVFPKNSRIFVYSQIPRNKSMPNIRDTTRLYLSVSKYSQGERVTERTQRKEEIKILSNEEVII